MRRRRFLGVAAAASLAGCTGLLYEDFTPEPTPGAEAEAYTLAVDYDGPWRAELAIGRDGGTERREVEGDGPDEVSLPADASHLEVWVEQRDGRNGILAIRLLEGEDVRLRSSIGDDGSKTGIDTSL